MTRSYLSKTQDSIGNKDKLLQQINNFNKVTRYKINAQNSVVFLYTNSDQWKEEIKKIPLTIGVKKNKILSNTLK